MTTMTKIIVGVFLSLLFIFLIFAIIYVLPGRIILAQYFSAGPIKIYYYGICMALAVGAGWFLARKRAPDFYINLARAENLIFWTIVGGFVGARFYHVFSSFGYYQSHPADMFKIWNGGLSIYGAVLGGMLAIVLNNRPMSKVTFDSLDWLVPSVALGQIIGRLGNMFNYELYGYPTSLPWKMFVPKEFRLPGFESRMFFHPLFLYEIIWNALVLAVLFYIEKRRIKNNPAFYLRGELFLWYLLLYNIGRFFLEFLRIDSAFAFGFRLNAFVSLVLALAAAGALICFLDQKKEKPQS